MGTTRTVILIAATVLVPSLAAHPAGDEAVAKLVFKVEEPRGYPLVSLKPEESPPDGVPPLKGEKGLRYSRRPLGTDARLLLAAKFWPEPAWIRVDRDFDGRLDDEEAMHFEGSSAAVSVTVEVQVLLDGEVTEVPLRFVHHHNPGSQCLHLTIPVRKEGFVELAGRLRPVALLDGDADLRFDGKGDGLYLDLDGDTEVKAGTAGRDRVTLGRPFRIDDSGWRATTRADGRVVFRRVEGDLPPPTVTWPKSGTPRAGSKAGTEKTKLKKLTREYDAAEKKDASAGANVFTERNKVLGRIGRVGSEAAFSFLWKTYENDSNVNVRAAAIRATGYTQYASHAAKLIDIAKNSGQVNFRTAAIMALHGMDAPGRHELLRELVADANHDSVFSTATRYLSYIATEKDLAMLEELARKETKTLRRRYAYEAATRYRSDPPPADLVRAAAGADDAFFRALGLEHAFVLALPDARALALASFASKQERVLLPAVRIVGSKGTPEDVEALLGLAGASSGVTREIVKLLRAVRREDSVKVLTTALAQRPVAVRRLAAEVLAGIPWLSVEEALAARARREKDPAVLAAILRALGMRETADAASALLAAAEAARGNHESLAAALDALARLGVERPDVRRFFEKVLKSKDAVDRMLALEAAASTGHASMADFLIDALTDKDWRVRLVAADGLGKVRVKRAVPILIDRLEDEETPRVRKAVEESLFLVTGQGFYDIVRLWRRWWAESGEAFEVPAEVPKRRPSGHKGASVASFYGVPVNSDRIIFVIDQSGSMSGAAGNMTKLERAVDETLKVVKKLKAKARVNVILFETNVHPWQKHLVKMAPGSKALLGKHLRSKRPTGGTNLYDGLEMALLTKDVDTIYLLSDGAPGSGKFVAHADILREIRRINRTRKVAIHCVAVGFDSPLMKDLAAENGGQYVRR